MKTKYKNFSELSYQQERVMLCIQEWVKTHKDPINQQTIAEILKKEGINIDSVRWALTVLLAKGYIRDGYSPNRLKSTYVLLRTI